MEWRRAVAGRRGHRGQIEGRPWADIIYFNKLGPDEICTANA